MRNQNSVAEVLGYVGADTSGSSLSYEHVDESNKRKPKKQEPKAVTPQKKPVPNFTTPERLAIPERLAREPSSGTTAKTARTEKKKRGQSIGSEIRKATGLYLRDKVDSMCVHPKYDANKNDKGI